ncbi:hypothetical protein VNO77_18274 [Canavalia gladiata]|uniref:Uncharacterized protein n=1 Tax=Canavalia gladiata TaxID=3824 RepID=A0AAN9LNX2_CANGL
MEQRVDPTLGKALALRWAQHQGAEWNLENVKVETDAVVIYSAMWGKTLQSTIFRIIQDCLYLASNFPSLVRRDANAIGYRSVSITVLNKQPVWWILYSLNIVLHLIEPEAFVS